MLFANLLLIFWDRNQLKFLFNKTPVIPSGNTWMDDSIWQITGLVMFLFTASYRFFSHGYNIFFWIGICLVIGIVGLIIGLRRRKLYFSELKS